MSSITSNGVDIHALETELRARVDGEVRFDEGTRAVYSTDSSNYRQIPIGVVVPRSVEAAVDALEVCRRAGVAVLNRGGGTSLAGQCCNVAVVVDWSKHCTAVSSVDVAARRAIVEPGLILDDLNGRLAPDGLMFGPRPATHSRCTIGGMIGNNACGSSAQAYGKTAENISRLEILTADGERLWVGPTSERRRQELVAAGGRTGELFSGLERLATDHADAIRRCFPDIPRRVSGFNLDALLPEHGFDVARALVGSESTLVTVLRAELILVPVVPARTMVVFGYPSIASAADAAPRAEPFAPISIEGLDATLLARERDNGMNQAALELYPAGDAWLVVEIGGANAAEARRGAEALIAGMTESDPRPSVHMFDRVDEQSQLLTVREAALGASAWHPEYPPAWSGWEDSAVAPDRLGDYLRELSLLFAEFGFEHVPIYGHFGHGCVHARIPFDLTTTAGISAYEDFLRRAAVLVVAFGGSLSGEHGDGQARGWLLPLMFGEEVMGAFHAMKELFDPGNRMNPGKIVPAKPASADLRLGTDYRPNVGVRGTGRGAKVSLQFSYPVEGDFAGAALRCVGVGECRSHTGGIMCPSYRATGDEEHSTRGRARLLFEMVSGANRNGPITSGWRSEEVRDALDLCLGCKGCLSDCPVDVDMATYKAEFLSHYYAGRVRPAAHYSMGWLPRWTRLVRGTVAVRLTNALLHGPGTARLLKRMGGIDPGRPLPWFAPRPFREDFRRTHPASGPSATTKTAVNGDVVLWADTFNNSFHPAVARAATRVLEDAGYRVILPEAELCCGLTWISTGQLNSAKRILRRTAAALRPLLEGGAPLVSLEPSCTAVFRADGPKLCPEDTDLALLAERTHTLSELLLATPGWTPPRVERRAVVQPHCHQHAVMGMDPDREVLARAGVSATLVGGCCGLAGDFGFEAGHLDVSIACAGHELLPAVEAAGPEALVLADGFSCRTQLEQLGGGRRAIHLAELLAGELSAVRPGPVQRVRTTLAEARLRAREGRY